MDSFSINELKLRLKKKLGADFIDDFHEGLAAFKRGGRWGFTDKVGDVQIPPKFQEVSFFAEGKAAVRVGKYWGFINRYGRIIIQPQFDRVFNFFYDRVVVVNNDKWGMIDYSGKIIIKPRYEWLLLINHQLAFAKRNDSWGVVDIVTGYEIIPCAWSYFSKIPKALIRLASRPRYSKKK